MTEDVINNENLAQDPIRTEHGFRFGVAKVQAVAKTERGNYVISISTKRHGFLAVHVTPTGLMRIWTNGKRIHINK